MSFSTPGMISDSKAQPPSLRQNMMLHKHLSNTTMMLQSPKFQASNFQAPNFQAPNFQAPNFQAPNFQAPNFQAPNFQALQIRNPWAQQMPNLAVCPPAQACNMEIMPKETCWGTSSMSPEVEMHLVSENITPEKASNPLNKTPSSPRQAHSWTSAEDLANAIFPSNYEKDAQESSHMHQGLLNHKYEIEQLRTTVNNIVNDMKTDFSSTDKNSDVHLALLDHKKHIESVIASMNQMKENNILQAAARAKADASSNMSSKLLIQNEQQEHMHEGLLNHKKIITHLNQDLNQGLTNHQKLITNLDQSLTNHKKLITNLDQSLTNNKELISTMDQALLMHKNRIRTMESVQADTKQVLGIHDKRMTTMQANNHREIESLQTSVEELRQKLLQLKSDQHVTTMSTDRTSIDHVINKLEALERQTLAELKSLKLGHNMLVDANKATNDKVTSLSKVCDRPQEKSVQFDTISYVRPPRSKFGI
jgi:hypothetical protein